MLRSLRQVDCCPHYSVHAPLFLQSIAFGLGEDSEIIAWQLASETASDFKVIGCYSRGEKCIILVQIDRTRHLVASSFHAFYSHHFQFISLDSLTYMKMDLARLLHMSSPVEPMGFWPTF